MAFKLKYGASSFPFKKVDLVEGAKTVADSELEASKSGDVTKAKDEIVESATNLAESIAEKNKKKNDSTNDSTKTTEETTSPHKFIPHPLFPVIGAWKIGKAMITGKPPKTFAGKLGKKVGAKIKNYITRKKLEGFEAARSEKLGEKYVPASKKNKK